jgi:hypothetical protein
VKEPRSGVKECGLRVLLIRRLCCGLQPGAGPSCAQTTCAAPSAAASPRAASSCSYWPMALAWRSGRPGPSADGSMFCSSWSRDDGGRRNHHCTRSITDPSCQADALTAVGQALAQAGRHQEAAAIAGSITVPDRRTYALSWVAGAMAQAGRHRQAIETARSISDPWEQTRVLAEVATALIQAGETHSASCLAPAACAAGPWTAAIRPVLLVVPSAFTALVGSLEEL